MAVVPFVHAMPLFGPPMQAPLEQSGHGWMPAMPVRLSPVRKMVELSGRTTSVTPVSHTAVPLSADDAALVTQTLVGMVIAFGTAAGRRRGSRHPCS
jgi:hypothetical protein